MIRHCLLAGVASGLLLTAVVSAADPDLKNLVRKNLPAATEIQGYPCAAGNAWFFADGALRECAVSRDTVFGEIPVPEKSWINLRHDGRPQFVFLAHNSRIKGLLCKGGGPLGPTEGASTALYPDGKLKICWLAEDSVVDGVPCAQAGFISAMFVGSAETEFHENGRLKSCRLSRDFSSGGVGFRRGERVRFDASGKGERPGR